jgi:hypothetical protein
MADLREALAPLSPTEGPADSETGSRNGSFDDIDINDIDIVLSDDDLALSDDDVTNPDTRVPKSMSTGSYIPPSSVPAVGLPPLRQSSPWRGSSKTAGLPIAAGSPFAASPAIRSYDQSAKPRNENQFPPKQRRCCCSARCVPRSSKRRRCCAVACAITILLLAIGAAVAVLLWIKPW